MEKKKTTWREATLDDLMTIDKLGLAILSLNLMSTLHRLEDLDEIQVKPYLNGLIDGMNNLLTAAGI